MPSQKRSLQYKLKVEERTHVITPISWDISAKGRMVRNYEMPHSRAEEATPTVPESEKKALAK